MKMIKPIWDCMISRGWMMTTIFLSIKHCNRGSCSSSCCSNSYAFALRGMIPILSATIKIMWLIPEKSWSRLSFRMTFWSTYSKSTRHSRFKKISKARIRLKKLCLLWRWGAFSWLPKFSMTYPLRFQLSSQMASFKVWSAAWRMVAFLLLPIWYIC